MHGRGLIAAKEKHTPTPKEGLLEEVGFNPGSSRWAKAACIFHHQRREHLGCPRPHLAWTLFPAQTSDPCQERPAPPHCPVMRPAQPLMPHLCFRHCLVRPLPTSPTPTDLLQTTSPSQSLRWPPPRPHRDIREGSLCNSLGSHTGPDTQQGLSTCLRSECR